MTDPHADATGTAPLSAALTDDVLHTAIEAIFGYGWQRKGLQYQKGRDVLVVALTPSAEAPPIDGTFSQKPCADPSPDAIGGFYCLRCGWSVQSHAAPPPPPEGPVTADTKHMATDYAEELERIALAHQIARDGYKYWPLLQAAALLRNQHREIQRLAPPLSGDSPAATQEGA